MVSDSNFSNNAFKAAESWFIVGITDVLSFLFVVFIVVL